jgi:hypothetical protein
LKLKMVSAAVPLLADLSGAAPAAGLANRKALTLDGALRAIAAAVAEAHKNHAAGVIRRGGWRAAT